MLPPIPLCVFLEGDLRNWCLLEWGVFSSPSLTAPLGRGVATLRSLSLDCDLRFTVYPLAIALALVTVCLGAARMVHDGSLSVSVAASCVSPSLGCDLQIVVYPLGASFPEL